MVVEARLATEGEGKQHRRRYRRQPLIPDYRDKEESNKIETIRSVSPRHVTHLPPVAIWDVLLPLT